MPPAPIQPWRSETRATLRLAYPLILTNLAQQAIAATDVALIGRLGTEAMAAAALGLNLYNICLFFGMGLVSAASPMIARQRGRMSHSVRDIRRTVHQAIWLSVAIVAPMWLILWHAEPLLLTLGQRPELAAAGQDLVRPLMFGLLPAFLFNVLRAFFAALERPGWTLAVAGLAVVVNALLNWLLILELELGLFGAGVGSAIANLLLFAGVALVSIRHPRFRRYRLWGGLWRPDRDRLVQLLRIGLPIAVTLAFEVTIFIAAFFLMGLIGTREVAAHQVAIQIAALSFMVPMGISQAATVRVGTAFGRRDAAAVARAGWTSYALGTGFMALTAILLVTVPHQLVRAFLDTRSPADAATAHMAVGFLGIAALFQIVDGAQAVAAGMLRGLHDTGWPMLFAGVGYWGVGMGGGAWLAFAVGLGGIGVWIGLASGLAAVALLMTGRWAMRERLGLI